VTAIDNTPPGIFYHGTCADLKPGDLITPGYNSNYGRRKQASWVYLTGTLDAAVRGAELAAGEGRGRIYVVEPTGAIEDDPNLTDQKFPGNEARSHAGGMASTAVTFSRTAPASRAGSRARSRIGGGTCLSSSRP
jgi:rifampin ADP-ribosyltransferase